MSAKCNTDNTLHFLYCSKILHSYLKEKPSKHFSVPQVPVRKSEFGSTGMQMTCDCLFMDFPQIHALKKDIKAEGRINMRLLFQGHLH